MHGYCGLCATLANKSIYLNDVTACAIMHVMWPCRLVCATFSCLDESTVPRLFTTMVRPHLEYGTSYGIPARYWRDKLEVEKIQPRATRLIPSLKGLSYEERLRVLKLSFLKYRRRRGDMIKVFKILKGIDRLDPDQFFTMSAGSTTRGHGQKMMKIFSHPCYFFDFVVE